MQLVTTAKDKKRYCKHSRRNYPKGHLFKQQSSPDLKQGRPVRKNKVLKEKNTRTKILHLAKLCFGHEGDIKACLAERRPDILMVSEQSFMTGLRRFIEQKGNEHGRVTGAPGTRKEPQKEVRM